MTDPDYRIQLDIAARLEAAAFFADLPVLVQRKGVGDSDIATALQALNPKGDKCGAVVIVLMPEFAPLTADAPGPEYLARYPIQVIETPFINLGEQGIGKSAELIASQVRQLLHYAAFDGSRVFTFASQAPADVEEGSISYLVKFQRRAIDEAEDKVPEPELSAAGEGPVVITASTVSAAAALWYTTDGSYPWSGNAAATLYAEPVTLSASCTFRCVAYLDGYQASNVATATIEIAAD